MNTEEQRPRRSRLLMPVALAACLATLAAAAAFWMRLAPAPERRGPPAFPPLPEAATLVGRPAPDFTLPMLLAAAPGSRAGGSLSLRSLRGQTVLLNFWASWCAPCRAETPLLVRLHKVYGPRGVAFVGVDTEDEVAEARRFVGQYHVDYPVVVSSNDRLMTAYAILGLPTTIFVGPDGVIRDREVGGFIGPDGEKTLVARLDRLLRTSP